MAGTITALFVPSSVMLPLLGFQSGAVPSVLDSSNAKLAVSAVGHETVVLFADRAMESVGRGRK